MRGRRNGERSRDRGGKRSWLATFLVVCLLALVVVSMNVPASSFTSLSLTRNASADVVADQQGLLGLDAASAGAGATLDLADLTNRFGQEVSLTVSLQGDSADRGDLVVDGINYGDSVTLSGVANQEQRTVGVAVFCNESYIGQELSYRIEISGSAASGTVERTQVITQHCISWYRASDWDGATSETGVVHDGFGDHNATDIEPGYDRDGASLVAYYPLDENSGTTANDVVNDLDGSIQGAPDLGVQGVLGTTAYAFDGVDDYVDLGSSVSPSIAGSSFTWTAWIRTTDDVGAIVAANRDNANSANRFQFYVASGGVPYVYDRNAGSLSGSITINDGAWHHVAVTLNLSSSTVRVYVDGQEDTGGDFPYTYQGSATEISSTDLISIGQEYDSDFTTSNFFAGRIEEVQIYQEALSQGAIRRLARGAPSQGSAVWNGTLTTAWEDTATIDVSALNLTDVVSSVPTGTGATLWVQSDTDGDGVPEETSDPIELDGSAGPFEVRGLSTDADRFRLRVRLNTTDINEASCFSAATMAEDVNLVRGSFSGCGKTDVTANEDPVASFTYSPTSPSVGQTVSFDASGSFDPDGTITEYRWDFDGDGNFDRTTTSATTDYTYDSPATYDVTLGVVDNESATNSTTKQVTVEELRLRWESPFDWDARVSEAGVVHEDFGDRNASWVSLGYPSSGTNLTDYFHLDEDSGSTVHNVGPKGRDGSIENGSIARVNGLLNSTAFDFSGGTQYVGVEAGLSDPLAGTASLSVWVKTTQVGDDTFYTAPGITGIESAGDATDIFWGWINGSGHIGMQAGNGNAALSTTPINDGNWHHVVLTYDYATGQAQVYVDGTLESSVTSATPSTIQSFSSIGRIEDDGGTPEYYNGTLDELRVYDAVLNGSQVDRLYRGTTPEAGIAWNGTLLTANKSIDTDLDVSAIELQNVSAEVPPGTNLTAYVQSDPDDDGIFEEESDAIELNGSFQGYAVSGLSTNSSTFRVRLSANTSDVLVRPRLDWIEIDTATDDPPTAEFTYSCSGSTCTFDASGSADPDGSIDSYEWDFDDGSTGSGEVVEHTFPGPGGYRVNLTVTSDGTTDSVEKLVTVNLRWENASDWDASVAESRVVHADYGDRNAGEVALGYDANGSGLVGFWSFDEDSGSTLIDHSGTGNNGTIQNGPRLGAAGLLSTTAYDFDGTDDYVVVPNSSSVEMSDTNEVTVSAWVKKESPQDGASWIAIFQHSDTSYNLQFPQGDVPAFTIHDGDWNTANSTLEVNAGEWYHLVGTFDGSTVRIYVNGTLQGTASASGIGGGNGFDVGIAENLDATGRHMNGSIDEVRLYERALSGSEVENLYETMYNGSLTTDGRTFVEQYDPDGLTLENVDASLPSNTGITVYVQSDPDGDGVFEEESAGIALNGSGGPYDVGGGSLSTDSATYRLRIAFNSSTVPASPVLDGIGLAPGSNGTTTNEAPTARFTYSCSGVTCSFDASGSSDPDGSIDAYDWQFGDGATGTGETTTHTYDSAGTYTVNLTVTDDDGATDSVEKTITVTARLRWASASDWDNATAETEVVHAGYGDRLADRVTVGVGTAGASLVSYWPLDEDSGTTVTDVVGSNDGTLQSGTVGATGIGVSTGYDFATSEYATLGDAINDGTFSLSLWFRPSGSSWSGTLYDMSNSNGVFYVTGSDSGITFRFDIRNKQLTLSGGTPAAGEWHHVLVTGQYGGKGPHKLYVDGVLVDSSQKNMNFGKPNLGTPRIGDDTGSGSTNGGFDGTIDEVRAYDAILTDTEASTLASGWQNGSLTTAAKSFDSSYDPTTLSIDNVVASLPSGTNITVYVESDPDGDGTFEEESAAIELDGSGGPYSVGGGTLSSSSSTYRLRLELDTRNVTVAPELDEIELTT